MNASISIEPIEYEKLSKLQKMAIFLVVMGPEAAAEILKNFDDKTIGSICKEIANYPQIDEETQRKVREEFACLINEDRDFLKGGRVFAEKALEIARGEGKAQLLISKAMPEVAEDDPFIKELESMDIRKIYNLVKEEQPQTIAFIAARLSTPKAVSLVKTLPQPVRDSVVEKMGSMDAVPVEYVRRVIDAFKKQVADEDRVSQTAGGVQNVANLLNALPKDLSKELIGKIEEKNEILGKAIRRKMFGFEDLVKVQPADLQRIMREVETSDLVLAMKNSSSKVQQAIFSSVSKRAAETLKEEMQMLGTPKVKDIEAAQDRIIQTVKRLEDQGEISLEDS